MKPRLGFAGFAMQQYYQPIMLGELISTGKLLHVQLRLDPLEIQSFRTGEKFSLIDLEAEAMEDTSTKSQALNYLLHARAAKGLMKIHGDSWYWRHQPH
ncbi:hypothetical protein EFK68_04085 [Pseudomonas aeruginosa]|nr:hypothetical protein EFK68_04085 [Pseudomonas aeruginosa]